MSVVELLELMIDAVEHWPLALSLEPLLELWVSAGSMIWHSDSFSAMDSNYFSFVVSSYSMVLEGPPVRPLTFVSLLCERW